MRELEELWTNCIHKRNQNHEIQALVLWKEYSAKYELMVLIGRVRRSDHVHSGP